MTNTELYQFLEEKTTQYNTREFIKDDPISIPHLFTKKPDIEIAGFFAAILAWGIRKTIISKCRELFAMMDWQPYDFMVNHHQKDALKLVNFKHRTFNSIDLAYCLEWFQWYYRHHDSLESAFTQAMHPSDENTGNALIGFHKLFFSLPESPHRTRKHVPTPERGSSCKRMNMYLRWMVRKDNTGVDFGIWNHISPSQLLCPIDLHVERVARKLGLISAAKVNWKGTLELTGKLKKLDPADPVKYDFALFGLGIYEKWGV